jgi:hypothetical protein
MQATYLRPLHPPCAPTLLTFSPVQGVKPWHAPQSLTPIFNELWDKIENKVVKDKFKTVTQIILDSYLKPTDQ